MDRIDGEPVRFYLEHRAQIDEWAALRAEAGLQARQALSDIAQQLTDRPPAGAVAARGDAGSWDAVRWYLPGWADGAGVPRAAIGIGWHSTRAGFHSDRAFIGVWRGQRTSPDAVTSALRSALDPVRKQLGASRSTWDVWPMYRLVPEPTGAFWDDLTGWNEAVITAANSMWSSCASIVDGVLSAPAGGAAETATSGPG